jgi:8-oxo-dGTP pyrophosphatase MutT (NUDIX family)
MNLQPSPEANVEVGVKATLFNADGELLMIRRATEEGNWDIPGGRIDPLEDAPLALRLQREMLLVGLRREVEEEIGLCLALDEPNAPMVFDIAKIDRGTERPPVIRLTSMGRLACPGEVRLSKEHTAFDYFSLDKARQLPVHDALAQTLRHPVMELAAENPTLNLRDLRACVLAKGAVMNF